MKSQIARFVWLVTLVAFAPPMLSQNRDESGASAKIMALEYAWNQAEALKDLKALDVLFDNGMTDVDSDGTLMTKAEFLAHVKSGGVVQVVTESMTVRIFDNTAIATGIYRAKAVKDGKPIFLRGRYVDSWVYQNAGWICVAAQSTPIP